ncbi:MAG: hypothetical protein KDB14_24600 [Planctomycetales bacterium]|nr:hypothetical protein [Planctomycetales bacterium]
MKKAPKPWYRPSRGVWYLTLHGRQVNLGADKDVALEDYKRLLAQPKKPVVSSESVVVLIDLFLDWCQKHRAAETYRWYFDRLQQFAVTIDGTLGTADIRPFLAQRWVDSQ